MANSKENGAGRYRMSTEGWPTERWVAIVVLAALAMLVLLRMGFRGVNVLGANVSVN